MQQLMKPCDPGRSGGIDRPRIGRGQLMALGVLVGFIALLGIWIWRVRDPNELPDIGDPFDVAEARRVVEISDSDNAYVVYAGALKRPMTFPASLSKVDFKTLTWPQAGSNIRDFLEQHRSALEIWREGSECPDAIYHQPGGLAMDTILPLVQDMRYLSQLGGLEGSRLEGEGAMDRAWDWYRAMLRSSRLVGRHGVIIERLVGASMHDNATRRILRWAAEPRVDAKLLRRALDDTIAADALTPPLSEALKLEYLICARDLEELRLLPAEVPMPGGRWGWLEQAVLKAGVKPQVQRILLHASNDVVKSRRAIRLLFANWLAQVDRPKPRRAPFAIEKPTLIYAPDPTAPPAARAVDPALLNQALDHAALAQQLFRPVDDALAGGAPMTRAPWEGDGLLAREPGCRSALIVKLAAELYRREHGHAPATAGVLVGSVIKALPEGIKPDDPIPAGID